LKELVIKVLVVRKRREGKKKEIFNNLDNFNNLEASTRTRARMRASLNIY